MTQATAIDELDDLLSPALHAASTGSPPDSSLPIDQIANRFQKVGIEPFWFVVQTYPNCERALVIHVLTNPRVGHFTDDRLSALVNHTDVHVANMAFGLRSHPDLRQMILGMDEVHYFLPTTKVRQKSRNVTQRLLLPGFLFVACNRIYRSEVETLLRDTPGASKKIFGFLHTDNQPKLRAELALIAERPVATIDTSFTAGQEVEVVAGPFMGLTGHVLKADEAGMQVAINLHLLGRYVSTILPRSDVEVLQ